VVDLVVLGRLLQVNFFQEKVHPDKILATPMSWTDWSVLLPNLFSSRPIISIKKFLQLLADKDLKVVLQRFTT